MWLNYSMMKNKDIQSKKVSLRYKSCIRVHLRRKGKWIAKSILIFKDAFTAISKAFACPDEVVLFDVDNHIHIKNLHRVNSYCGAVSWSHSFILFHGDGTDIERSEIESAKMVYWRWHDREGVWLTILSLRKPWELEHVGLTPQFRTWPPHLVPQCRPWYWPRLAERHWLHDIAFVFQKHFWISREIWMLMSSLSVIP